MDKPLYFSLDSEGKAVTPLTTYNAKASTDIQFGQDNKSESLRPYFVNDRTVFAKTNATGQAMLSVMDNARFENSYD